jgi:hypothetical protein
MALASHLSGIVHPAEETAATLEVVDVSDVPPVARDVLTQPAKSFITAAEVGEMRTYIIKRYGWIRTYFEFVVINMLYVAMLVFLGWLTWSTIAKWRMRIGDPLWPVVITIAFAAFVAFLMLRQFHVFFRRCILITSPEGLTRMTQGPFGKTERLFELRDIARILTEANEQRPLRLSHGNQASATFPVSLVLTTRARERVPLLKGQQLDLRWLATQLRRDLGIPLRA